MLITSLIVLLIVLIVLLITKLCVYISDMIDKEMDGY